MAKKKTLARELITDALLHRSKNETVAAMQPQYDQHREFAAIKQCMDNGIILPSGELSERTMSLLSQYKRG